MAAIDRSRLQSLMQREQKKFVDERPKSKALFDRARKSLLAGVPMFPGLGGMIILVREQDAAAARRLIEEHRQPVPASDDDETAEIDVIEDPSKLN